ncbi:hypothetical protein [Hymenobacter sp. UYCo722]|uniref:hypothetical protein n=1 Tax=Hymenobacter sp. UYCo722 TaxID=3156335 RepID=UPI003397E7C5
MFIENQEIDVKKLSVKLRSVFSTIKARCYKPKDPGYKYYGGRGVTISPEWTTKDGNSRSFVVWAWANGFQAGYHLVRLDKGLPFGPDNCKWVSAKESRRTGCATPQYVEYKGEQVTLVSLVDRFHPGYSKQMLATIKKRVSYLGWDAESAVTMPIVRNSKRPPGVTRIKATRRRCDRQEDGIRKGTLLNWYYSFWSRTTNPNEPGYKHYGGRGITFSPEWSSASPFVEWSLANGYQLGLLLVRINKRLPYGPGNCHWVSREKQRRANANAQYVKYKGEWVLLLELVERVYPDYGRFLLKQIKTRINMLGWDVETAVDTPIHPAGLHILPVNTPRLLAINKSAIEWLI